MNREILFKGFHPCENGRDRGFINGEWINGKWVEGNHLYDEMTDKHYIIPFGNINESQKVGQEGCCYCVGFEVIPETVGQYTGVTDKNGKKIFEGDIVKTHYANTNKTEFVEQVIFEGGSFRAKTKYTDNSSHSALLYNGVPHLAIDKSAYMDSIEVIGNIHDNPELLEVSE